RSCGRSSARCWWCSWSGWCSGRWREGDEPLTPLETIPGVVEALVVRGARAPAGAPPDLLIEVPHGATRTADFTALERLLASPLPPSLVDFFHVNTDAGAPELGEAVARRFVAAEPARAAA